MGVWPRKEKEKKEKTTRADGNSYAHLYWLAAEKKQTRRALQLLAVRAQALTPSLTAHAHFTSLTSTRT